MKRYILNILGSFGSGKSSLARALMPKGEKTELTFAQAFEGYNLHNVRLNRPLATLFPESRLAFVGPYRTACGGCDALVKLEIITALDYLVQETQWNIIFEGALISGVRTYQEYLRSTRPFGLHPMVIVLHAPLEVHHARVLQRNGGKPINPKHISGKHRAVHLRIQELEVLGDLPYVVINENTIEKTFQRASQFIHQQTHDPRPNSIHPVHH